MPLYATKRLHTYRYTAKDAAGRRVRGTAAAEDREELYRQLHREGLYLQSAWERSEGKRRMLRASALSEFCRQLSGLLSSGVSLARALSILSQEEGLSGELKGLCAALLAEVRTGVSLADAMENRQVFPKLVLGMVRSGVSTGRLDDSLGRLALHYEKQRQMEQSVRSAMTYPAILCVMALVVVTAIFTLVLPQFRDVFEGLGDMPLTTRVLLAVSDHLARGWYWLALGALALGAAFHFLAAVPEVRFRLDFLKLKAPLFGHVNQLLYTARFAHSLSSLYSGGMPVISALETARDTIGNTYIESQFARVLEEVRGGAPLSAALRGVDGFRSRLAGVIALGEESGSLDSMLESVAVAMEFDAQQSAKRLVTVLEPLLIVVIALAVGFIMVGVMLPIVQSYGSLESAAYF